MKATSSHRRCSVKNLFFKISQYSQENACVGLSSLIKSFMKKRLQHRCFPVNIAKFLRTPILKNICERLFLESNKRKGVFRTLQNIFDGVFCENDYNPLTTFAKISIINVYRVLYKPLQTISKQSQDTSWNDMYCFLRLRQLLKPF